VSLRLAQSLVAIDRLSEPFGDMIDRILANYRESTFDSSDRVSDDPLAYLFGEWIGYYRLKAAIAQAIVPQTF